MIALLGKQNFAYWVIFKSMFPIQNRKAILRMLHPNQTKWGKKEEIWWREPGCFGTGQLAALVGSEVQPYPPGTAFCLFTFFHLFFWSDFSPFTPRHSLFPPLASLSTHYPSTVPTALQGRGAWQAWRRRQPIPPSHWSEPAAPVLSLVAACRWWCLGRGDWLQMWTKGCLQKCSLLTIVFLTDSTWSHSVRLLILVYSSMRETLHWVSEDQVWKIVNFFLTMRSGGLNLHLESGSRWWCKELPD